jgi:hypothetical protein
MSKSGVTHSSYSGHRKSAPSFKRNRLREIPQALSREVVFFLASRLGPDCAGLAFMFLGGEFLLLRGVLERRSLGGEFGLLVD